MKEFSDLKEVKRNKCGTGLLIENDGYVTTTKEMLKEGIENKDEWYVPYPFVVNAVFQKFGIKNANGRVYPEDVLKREVEKYQEKIKDRRALGECYTDDAMILTSDGWKMLKDVKEGEHVLTLNTETNNIEIKPILRKIEKDWDGEVYHIHNRNINDLVTSNHKYPIFSETNKFKGFYTADDINDFKIKNKSKCFIPKRGNWIEQGDEFFILKGIPKDELNTQLINKYPEWLNDKKIPMGTFMKFMGIYLSEGNTSKDNNYIFIHQKNEENIKKIQSMLEELGFPFSKLERGDKNGYVFRIHDKRLRDYVHQLGICYDKYIPIELKNQSKENLRLLYDWFVMGDGRIRGDKRDLSKQNRKNYSLTDDVFSTSKQLILDLNEIQLKIGYSGNFHIEKRNNDRYIHNRLIEGKNTHPMYFSLRSLSNGIRLDNRFLKIDKVNYNGKVYCIEVENNTWYVMQNDKSHWTGNCNHPESSSIDLSRVSHNITELHWEGSTLVGTMEIFTSYGFRKQGIVSTCGDMVANLLLNGYKIGVSSRAIGSVEEKLGVLLVGEDLELLCWDIVADPSTPNAYIFDSEEEKSQYVEDKKKDNSKLLNKINKIKNII